jgi:hypothetical protein
VYDRAAQIQAGIADARAFEADARVDAFRGTPAGQLLTGLRGDDVMVTFIESYGRVAIEDPQISPGVDAVLADGEQKLRAAGYGARTAFLTSPTFGGGSWLAHATLLSGLWINNQRRYANLVASDRFTLNGAFKRAGWRTAGTEPAVTKSWPEAAFFQYDDLFTADTLEYKGPLFNFSSVPDQFNLATFHRHERAAPDHPPVFGEVVLLSSHVPWTPLPEMVDWDQLGDGSKIYKDMNKKSPSAEDIANDRNRVKAQYMKSVQYSLSALLSYVERYGGTRLVLVFLGDHQPAPVVAGEGASRDVPVTVVAHDPAVLDKISSWGWQDGLKPDPHAPVWRMDTFRDRFLTAFGSAPH